MSGSRTALTVAAAFFAAATCGAVSAAEAKSHGKAGGSAVSGGHGQHGAASWYGPGFHSRRTANGEIFNIHALTAAHRNLPFGTKVRVTNERTGRSVVVRINDRGPYAHGRIIDLLKSAAQAVGVAGVGRVTLTRL